MTMRALLVPLLLLVPACGGSGAFGHRYPDNRTSDLDAVTARLSAAAPPSGRSLAVGVATSPPGLYAFDLDAGRVLFQESAELGTVPHLAGDYVVTEEGDDAVVRRLADGRETARIARQGLRLVGAAGEGALGVLVLSTTAGAVAESIMVVLHDGAAGGRTQVDQVLGEPAVRAGMLFVPWGHQNVSVIDGDTGGEIARLRVREVVGHAISRGGDVFVGQSSLARFGSHLLSDPSWLAPSETERSSGAELFDDAYAPPPSAVSAAHHVRMAVAPVRTESNAGAALVDDTLYELFYRTVFALEGVGSTARWARVVPADLVGASALDHGLLVADEAGEITLYAATDGRPSFHASTGIASSYVAFHAEGFAPSAPATGEALVLRDQLLALAADTDGRLVPARAFAVRLLGALPEAEVTANLIALCEDRSAAPLVHTAACDTLGARTVGASAVLDALGRHAAYLAGTSAPPVGALARAAANMGERGAVPLLLAQLRDPGTPAADLPAVCSALETLGDATVLEPLADWLRLYHAEPDGSDLAPALAAAATAYATLAGPTKGDLLQPLIDDVTTHALLRERARELMVPAPPADAADTETPAEETEEPSGLESSSAVSRGGRAPEASAVVGEASHGRGEPFVRRPADGSVVTDVPPVVPPTRSETAATSRADSEEARERAIASRRAARVAAEEDDRDDTSGFVATPYAHPHDELPSHLTTDMVRNALSDFRRDLRECLVTDRLTHGSARVLIVVDPAGAVLMVHTTPTEIHDCVEPLIRSASYPATAAHRHQTVTYEIRR